MDRYVKRMLRVAFGSSLMGVGSFMTVQANIGLSPWTAFAMGLSVQTGHALGSMMVATSLGIIVVDLLLKEKIGIGTIINAFLVGGVMNLLQGTGFFPLQTNFFLGVLMLVTGLFVISLGTFFYISPGLGAGPRDTLMVAIGKRLAKTPIGAVRSGLEGTVLLAGWLMGGKVGVGTIISVFGIGIVIQMTFQALRFKVRAVKHESLFDSAKILCKKPAVEPE